MSLRGRPISKNPNKFIIHVHVIQTIQKSKIMWRTKYVSICVHTVQLDTNFADSIYRKVASSSMSRLVAHI